LTAGNASREEVVKEIEPLLAQIPVADIKEAADEAQAIPDRSWRMGFLHMLLTRWVKADGLAAATYLAQSVKGDMQLPLLGSVLPLWAEHDTEGAWNWFQTAARQTLNFDARGMHNAALGGMFTAMGRNDFEHGLNRALELEGIDLINAHQGLAQGAQTLDQRLRLIAQADNLTDAQTRDDARKAIFAVWAGSHADEARAYVEALADPARRSEGARLLGPSLMASTDPAQAADWWLRQTTDADRSTALNEISLRWAEIDLVGAADWLGKQGNSPEMDRAKQSFAIQASQRAPEAAANWANTITDEKRRFEALRTVYRLWRGKNADAAQAWLAKSGLTPEQQQAVREP
jgi:hypothetical protein